MEDQNEMVSTAAGLVERSRLTITEHSEEVPCGECVTTCYFLGDVKVRQDIKIIASKGFELAGTVGEVGR